MIKHIVFWKINKDGTDSDRRATVDAFRKNDRVPADHHTANQIRYGWLQCQRGRCLSRLHRLCFRFPWMI